LSNDAVLKLQKTKQNKNTTLSAVILCPAIGKKEKEKRKKDQHGCA